jgi:hypothetical protein
MHTNQFILPPISIFLGCLDYITLHSNLGILSSLSGESTYTHALHNQDVTGREVADNAAMEMPRFT